MGVGTHDINDDLAVSLGLKDKKKLSLVLACQQKWAFVLEGVERYPAAKAGIRPGDIISEMDGKRIGNTTYLQHAIRHNVDTKIIVKVIRDGVEVRWMSCGKTARRSCR